MDDNEEKLREAATKVKDESKDDTATFQKNDVRSVDAAIDTPKATGDTTAEAGSKKRAREDDDETEKQGNSKKVDLKVEES